MTKREDVAEARGTAPKIYEARYLRGHSAFPKSMNVNAFVAQNCVEIPEMQLVIPFKHIIKVQSVTEEKPTMIGLLSRSLLFKRKNKPLVVLIYENESGFEENMVFQVESLDEVELAKKQCTTKTS